MIEINLLPWRAMMRAENTRRKNFFLGYLSVLILLWAVIHAGFNLALQAYDSTMNSLQAQLTELLSQTQKNPVNPSFVLVDQIHSSQRELMDFFKVLEQTTSEKIVWSSIESKKNRIVTVGNSDSFSSWVSFVNAYNEKNKGLAIRIMSAKNNFDTTGVQCRLGLVRSASLFMSEIKDDDED